MPRLVDLIFMIYSSALRFGDITSIWSNYTGKKLYFFALEQSLHDPHILVAGCSHALVMIHEETGVMKILAGSLTEYGYSEGIGEATQFSMITGIAQQKDNYLIADSSNNCWRTVHYETGETRVFAGSCSPLVTHRVDGELLISRFSNPVDLKLDTNNSYLVFVAQHRVLRKVDLQMGIVTTLTGFYLDELEENVGMAYQFNKILLVPEGDLLISTKLGILTFRDGSLDWVLGRDHITCEACNISSDTPLVWGMQFIIPTFLLGAATTLRKLVLIDMIAKSLSVLEIDHQGLQLSNPLALAIDESYIYIYIYIGESTENYGGIKKLSYAGIFFLGNR